MKMKFDLFKEYCDLYGGDLTQWPDGYREQAELLIKTNSDHQQHAQAYLKQTRSLDLLLHSQSLPDFDLDNMTKRIVNSAIQEEQLQEPAQVKADLNSIGLMAKMFGMRFKPAYVFAPSGSLMALALLGFWVGTSGGLSKMTYSKNQTDYLMDPIFYAESNWQNEMEELVYSLSEEGDNNE